ncbi:MAG: hypothetical protein KAQ93_02730 [Spirochaetales bacterium]|nr:hypothetical protein [Spirochaetales bacterium]
MIIFKKYVEGITMIDDNTGESRLLSDMEKLKLISVIPVLSDPKTISYMIDFIPEELNTLYF